jgi:ribulose-phosphate 3-epimerase
MNKVKIAPSLLAADFARLGEEVRAVEAAGADRLHLDVMDGHFVPNITIGPLVVECLRPITKLPLEAHLMIEEPDRYLEAFARAGADTIIVHVERSVHLHRTLQAVRALGKRVGVSLNPLTPAAAVEEVLPWIDLLLVMTVNPGFGGQQFLAETMPKLKRLADEIVQRRLNVEIEVDGGIDSRTAPMAVAAGATVLVAGSAIFRHAAGPQAGLAALRAACASA